MDFYLSKHNFTLESEPPVHIDVRPNLINTIPDGIIALLAPIVAYWVFSVFFHIIDTYQLAEKYRIHPSEEVLSRNKATRSDVFKDVIIQHIIQTIVGYAFYRLDPTPTTGYELNEMWSLKQKFPFLPSTVIYYLYYYGFTIIKLIISMVIIDSWQFYLHRAMHLNKWLYKHFHSRHHRLYVPYAFGALYNDPVEGFLLDTLGTGVAAIVTRLTPREAIVLYSFATMKTVDDHCGYAFPWDPFQMLFPNNSIYHDIHHQHFGIKTNFSQPFFTFWDRFHGTDYKLVNAYKEDQKKLTAERYRLFLSERKKKSEKSK